MANIISYKIFEIGYEHKIETIKINLCIKILVLIKPIYNLVKLIYKLLEWFVKYTLKTKEIYLNWLNKVVDSIINPLYSILVNKKTQIITNNIFKKKWQLKTHK